MSIFPRGSQKEYRDRPRAEMKNFLHVGMNPTLTCDLFTVGVNTAMHQGYLYLLSKQECQLSKMLT